MPFNLKGRHLLTLKDYTPEEIGYLLDLSAHLKQLKYAGIFPRSLQNRNIALIFDAYYKRQIKEKNVFSKTV